MYNTWNVNILLHCLKNKKFLWCHFTQRSILQISDFDCFVYWSKMSNFECAEAIGYEYHKWNCLLSTMWFNKVMNKLSVESLRWAVLCMHTSNDLTTHNFSSFERCFQYKAFLAKICKYLACKYCIKLFEKQEIPLMSFHSEIYLEYLSKTS
jgi:hypothetical protein